MSSWPGMPGILPRRREGTKKLNALETVIGAVWIATWYDARAMSCDSGGSAFLRGESRVLRFFVRAFFLTEEHHNVQ
jgi:hypothetical protein